MAILNIDILNPTIDLISNEQLTNNSCKTVHTFDIISPGGSLISITGSTLEGNTAGFDKVEYNYNGRWLLIPNVNKKYDSGQFSLRSTGSAKVRVTIGNVENMPWTECNHGFIKVFNHTYGKNEAQKFTRCITATRCETPAPAPTPPPPVIEPDTNIRIYFDNSGSMDSTLAPLEAARIGSLRTALLEKYDNNVDLYESRVKIVLMGEKGGSGFPLYENPLRTLNFNKENLSGKVISMVFMDESDAFASPEKTIFDPSSTAHNNDLAALRTRLEEFPQNYYRGILFQVATPLDGGFGDDDLISFKEYVQAIDNGTGVYGGTNGLSDKTEVSFNYDTPAGATEQDYTNLIINKLNEFGFNIS